MKRRTKKAEQRAKRSAAMRNEEHNTEPTVKMDCPVQHNVGFSGRLPICQPSSFDDEPTIPYGLCRPRDFDYDANGIGLRAGEVVVKETELARLYEVEDQWRRLRQELDWYAEYHERL